MDEAASLLPIALWAVGQYSLVGMTPPKGSTHMTEQTHALTPQDCLVAVMIAQSISDQDMRISELVTIETIVNHLPIFADYDADRIKQVGSTVFELFSEEDGLDALFGLIRENLPEALYETAYAMACDVIAADGRANEQELRLLEEIRYELDIDRLHGAAIERGARARYRVL